MTTLFVEDNIAVLTAVIEGLTEGGVDVTSASSADAALALIEQQEFDVLVTDIHLDTELGGVDVAAGWRSRYPDKPIVFATAYPRSDIKIAALRHNDGYLVKPFSPAELLKLINFVLNTANTATPTPVEGNDRDTKSGEGSSSIEVDDKPWLS